MRKLTLRERQLRQLEILKDIDFFCRTNHIAYTLSSGTLLGAVRHGGFIPWDDDIDIYMLRKDYDIFINSYSGEKYKLLCNTLSNLRVLSVGYAKLTDPFTFEIDRKNNKRYGLFVDIFPLDGIPDDPKKQYKYFRKACSIHNRFYHRHRKDFVSVIKSYLHSIESWGMKIDWIAHNPILSDSEFVSHLIGTNGKFAKIRRTDFKNLKDISFEGFNFLAIPDIHSYLCQVYGTEYMTPVQYPMHQQNVYLED